MAKSPAKKSPTKAETKAALDAAKPVPEVSTADVKEARAPAAEQANSEAIYVFDELVDNCRAVSKGFADQSSKESDRDFMLRVFTVISDMPEDGSFEAMQAKTQNWYNEAAAAESEGKPWELPEGFVSKFGKGAAPAAKAPKAPKAEAAPKAAKEPKVVAPKAPKPEGVTSKVRRIILANPTTKLAEIQKLVAAELPGTKPSTVATLFSDSWATLKIAQELGWRAAA